MATSEDNDLIGYDPLAWMEGDTDKNEDHLVTDEIDSDTIQEGAACDGEMSMSDDYSDELIGNTEEDLVLDITEDELVINEIEDDNDSALLEDADDDGIEQLPIATQEDVAAEETGSTQFDLDATLSIQNVVKLHEKLKSFVAVHDQIEINASDVSSIDTATLQLLVSLKKDAAKLQKQVTIIYPSPRFVESAHLLGLLSVLDVHDV
ncbi:MAG: STAS domain-containing protein [Methylobacter sp.]